MATAKPKEQKEKETKYYYSRSAKHRLAGFWPETFFPSGKRKHGDRPITFSNHWVISDDPLVQKFIENHKSFNEPEDNPMIKLMTKTQFDLMLTKDAQKRMQRTDVSRQDYGTEVSA